MEKKNKETKDEKLSFREKMKDKRYSAKVQLIGYGIFIILVLIYTSISTKKYNNPSNNTNNKNNDNGPVEKIEDKKLLDAIKDNYHYEVNLSITEEETKDYIFTGDRYNDIVSINYNNNIFYSKDNEYYAKQEDNYVITDKKTVYGDIDNNYLELNSIINYIKKSKLDRTTEYSSGEIDSVYYLYLKDIIPNYMEEDYIEITVNEKEDILSINIDYSNFMNYKDKKIKKYIVNAKYNNINKIEEFKIGE